MEPPNLIKFVAHLARNSLRYIRRWTAFKSLRGCKFYTVHRVSLSLARNDCYCYDDNGYVDTFTAACAQFWQTHFPKHEIKAPLKRCISVTELLARVERKRYFGYDIIVGVSWLHRDRIKTAAVSVLKGSPLRAASLRRANQFASYNIYDMCVK